MRGSYWFAVRVGYFTEGNWLCVAEPSRAKAWVRYRDILRDAETDKLNRSEARQDSWQAWRE